ncbi:hypothetical protein ABW19_dt0210454 [Dactylella cylindrospora]|nr:hypothetical protein ABW19_dt0210454 [Dactylella cylindrospora]
MSAESSPEPPQLVEAHSHVDAKTQEAFGQLGDLELEFEKAEVEVLKYQIQQTTPLYARRNLLTTSIPSFWPTVFDSTPDFDQHIAPSDVMPISTITSVNVIRPNASTEPRDFIIELSFDPARNEWFEETTLAKRFWWKTVDGKWSGLVSEPVNITWKEGNDLSGGETGRVCEEWIARKAAKEGKSGKGKGKGAADKGKGKGKANGEANGKKKSLEEKLAGGQPSFFTWFAWIGKGTDFDGGDEEEEEEDGDLFNHGDELALTIADDVYPNAIKYFLEAVTGGDSEGDSDMSVSDLEDDEDEDEEVININIDEDDSDEDESGVGSSKIKRHDITPPGEEEEEDESYARRKRVKK